VRRANEPEKTTNTQHTIVFTDLDAVTLQEHKDLAARLAFERQKELTLQPSLAGFLFA